MTDFQLPDDATFAQDHGHEGAGARRWRRRIASPWSVVVLGFALVLALDPATFGLFSRTAVGAFLGTLPYVALAVGLIAWLKAAGAEAAIAGVFKGREAQMIVLGALFGGLAPFCSCQVIPFIAGLLSVGAPISAVMAFWLSSPLIDPPTLLITASALGWPFAIAKAVAAVGLGLFGGFVTWGLVRTGVFADPLKPFTAKSSCGCGPSCGFTPMTGRPVWRFWNDPARRETFRAEAIGNAAFLVKWLALAYVLEAALILYVPADLVAGVVGGDGLAPIGLAALVGMPTYLNGYVAPPLLAGLTAQGMSMGAAMAFVVAGGVSCVPAMAAVWSMVKPRVFAAYIGLGLSGAVIAGVVFQAVA
jgi:hypothetical protein